MRLEPLTKAIEQADYLAFREIALAYMTLRGFREVELKDGPKDGGSDLAIRTQGTNPVPIAIAITVQRSDWKSKVRSDCRRAKEALGLTNALYVTSRRLPTSEFTPVADELWEQDGIAVQPADSQAIASLLFQRGEADCVLKALGISPDIRRPDSLPRPDLKEDAAYAFAFFGEATDKFRQSVIEQTILSYITRNNSTTIRSAVESAVGQVLQLHPDQTSLVSSSIDRMLQQQRVYVSDGHLKVDDNIVDELRLMRALKESQWQALARKVDEYLALKANLSGANLERTTQCIMERAGSLFIDAASSASATIDTSTASPSPIRAQLRKRLREIGAALTAAGMADHLVEHRLEDLAKLVSNSSIGRSLMAGELFVNLASMRTDDFERAFGAQGNATVYLDASVAIPMITALFFEPADHRFSKAALRAYDLTRAHEIPLRLPRVYLEEAASHLMDAVDLYRPILGMDDDLRYSQNAFVAHFSDLTARGTLKGDFLNYAKRLGYTDLVTSRDRQRQNIVSALAHVFATYTIDVVTVEEPGQQALRDAQEAITFTVNEQRIVRSGRLLSHDVTVVASLIDTDSPTATSHLFCTWDRLHLRLETPAGRAHWQAFDPPTLGDLLILARPNEVGDLMTTVSVAMELSEEQGRRGADVLDSLVRIESGLHFDAELLELARQFKEAYLDALRADAEPDDLAEAWAQWKSGNRDLTRQPKLEL